jgi:hypothetical protein
MGAQDDHASSIFRESMKVNLSRKVYHREVVININKY